MKKRKILIVAKMTLVIFFLIGLFSALAIPKYFDLNKQTEACQCCANQIIVETALTLAYAESLAVGSDQFPEQLTPEMFADGKIPTCPVHEHRLRLIGKPGRHFVPIMLKGMRGVID